MTAKNLVLIGYRGTGKSTVAAILAEQLGWSCVDADALLEERAGQPIAQIFATDGEAAFRNLESEILSELVERDNCVLALGGGAVLRAENRQAIARAGHVVWLTGTPEVLFARIQADTTTAARRPNLTSGGGITEIIATLAARQPFYQECAHQQVDTTSNSPREVALAILRQWTPA